MNFDFIFSAWWQYLGAFLFVVAVIFCSYQLTKDLEDETEDEEPTINRYEARITKAVK